MKTQTNQVHSAPLVKRMWQSSAIAFIVAAFFVLSAGEGDPGWPQYWYFKPLIVTPIAASLGGIAYYLMDGLRSEGGWKSFAANLVSIVCFLFILWISIVLGLDGTMWN